MFDRHPLDDRCVLLLPVVRHHAQAVASGGHGPACPKPNIPTELKIGISLTDRNFGIPARVPGVGGPPRYSDPSGFREKTEGSWRSTPGTSRAAVLQRGTLRFRVGHAHPRNDTLDTFAAFGGLMEQSLASRSPMPSLPVLGAAQGTGAVAGRERPVLLRIPDCSDRIYAAAAADSSQSFLRAAWIGRLVTLARGLMGPWRRPRGVVAGALGVALILGTVVLLAATRPRGANHAGSDRRGESLTSPTWTSAGDAGVARSNSATEAASMLDEAPRFPSGDVNQVRSNQPASLDSSRAGARGADTKATTDKRNPPGPCAHIEPRIDRVSTQY